MEFLLGVVIFAAGSILIGLCIVAIPGPGGTEERPAASGHGHGGH